MPPMSSSSSSSSSSSYEPLPDQPGPTYLMTSSLIMGLTASLSRVFLYGLNTVEVTGLQRFLDILDERKDIGKRKRGLLTVCNHISVLDDPIMWGALPFKYAFNPPNHRWGLGAHDICFKNNLLGSFFSAGQILPTHRLQYSPHGGLFQPTLSRAIQLLSSQDRHGWVHVFPEACVHQHPKVFMRYFKWGVSRMILESEPMPDVLPIFIDGMQRSMPEDRVWPRFVPRLGVRFRVAFGEPVDTEKTFGDLRAQWQELARQHQTEVRAPRILGELPEGLKYGEKAVELRIEVARRLREEVLKVRRGLGYPDDEPSGFELADTWSREPGKDKFKSNVDDSLVNKRQ